MTRDSSFLTVERNTKTLRQLALEKIREAILRFHFMPGDRLVERELCKQLGVSRSVVREVIRHLEAEGLVENIPNQGPAVARLDPAKVDQIYEIRGTLEAMAAQTCAAKCDPQIADALSGIIEKIDAAFQTGDPPAVLRQTTEFYRQLFLFSGKTVAWEIVSSLNARINHLRALTISSSTRHKNAIAEMKVIQSAIANGDEAEAARAALEHIEIVAGIARTCLDNWAEHFPHAKDRVAQATELGL